MPSSRTFLVMVLPLACLEMCFASLFQLLLLAFLRETLLFMLSFAFGCRSLVGPETIEFGDPRNIHDVLSP